MADREGVLHAQEYPVCAVDYQPVIKAEDCVYAAPCGHPECPSAVFHAGCAMDYAAALDVCLKDGMAEPQAVSAAMHLVREHREGL